MKERRSAHRYKLALPIRVRRALTSAEQDFLKGEVCDISTSGVFFTTNEPFTEDEALDFSLAFPGLAQTPEAFVTGRVRVLRVMRKRSESMGVAARIEAFQIAGSGPR